MTSTLDLKKINKTIKIFAAVQCALVALLVFMAVQFQVKLQSIGRGSQFMTGVVVSFVVQLVLFYPIFRFAAKEANRDFSVIGRDLSKEETKAFIKQKRWADVIKISVFGFFFIFFMALKASTPPVVMSVIYYSFILTILTYLQCYNFAIKRCKREQTN
ncbi:MAG TPA: hypothetical protein DCZ75_10895 [Geobacter sp.]|nr:hypothetical protein [Geobacter sp.]